MPRRAPYLRKLDFESLHYSCRVCSNHVRYFNKREQQGGNWIPRPASSAPASRPPPRVVPPYHGQPIHPRRSSPCSASRVPSTIYIYIATTVILLRCLRVYLAPPEIFSRRIEMEIRILSKSCLLGDERLPGSKRRTAPPSASVLLRRRLNSSVPFPSRGSSLFLSSRRI